MQKKYALLPALLLLLSTVTTFSANLDLGINAGASFAHLNYVNLDTKSDRAAGFIGGVSFGISNGEIFEIQPELLYAQKGEQADYLSGSDTVTLKTTLHYVEIPLLFKWNFGQAKYKTKGFAYVGPHTSLLLGAKLDDTDIKELYNTLDVGITFGLGFGVPVGSGAITLDVRNSIGFLSAIDSEDLYDALNANISILMGYTIDFGASK